MGITLAFYRDDLTGAEIRGLNAHHLAGMHAHSPDESVHALDIDRPRHPDVTFWSACSDQMLVGCGALRHIDAARGELKSTRVVDAFLGRGVGKAILVHLTVEARARGYQSRWLEIGSSPAFVPALALYTAAGFTRSGPFEGYGDDPFSAIMTRTL